MARYYGKIGYAMTEETTPGVYRETVIERAYRGDVIRNRKQTETGEWLNDDINVSNEISILADAFAYDNFYNIRYVEYMGAKWKVRSVDVNRPRLTLSIGGVYNEQTSS